MTQSILDKVLSSQKASALSNFEPEDVLKKLFEVLGERERDVLSKRHGLSGNGKVTLEEIGNTYNVTRERVRQIENASIKRIREAYAESLLHELEFMVRAILEDHGDLMSERRLVTMLLSQERSSDRAMAIIRFLLNQLLDDRLHLQPESNDLYKSWATPSVSWDEFNAAVQSLVEDLEKHGEPLPLEELLERSHDKVKLRDTLKDNFESVLANYLDATKHIEENRFNEWGLSKWSSVKPRRMNDKIYIVLKREGKPLHFTAIAERINQAVFDKRIAYPATIHNELILDDKYVLVGRGIYALKEWGYKPGVVADVIREVIEDAGKPMQRDDIVDEVLKRRMVKKSTVLLSLMNKKHFVRNPDGSYWMVK